jgi:hypothetical protein
MRIIAFITDFGLEDEFVGVMKGVVLSINPSVLIVDINHNIPSQNVLAGALCLERSFRYFPEGTVFTVIVDPGVGSGRKSLVTSAGGYFFVAPDNGVLTPIFEEFPDFKAFCISKRKYMLDKVSSTFHGRDIFAPASAYITLGVTLPSFGPPIKNPVRLDIPKPFVKGNKIVGAIVHVDKFGNLITNIKKELFQKFIGSSPFKIKLGRVLLDKISSSYSDVGIGEICAVWGSSFTLEIAVNGGQACNSLDLHIGDSVIISRFA